MSANRDELQHAAARLALVEHEDAHKRKWLRRISLINRLTPAGILFVVGLGMRKWPLFLAAAGAAIIGVLWRSHERY